MKKKTTKILAVLLSLIMAVTLLAPMAGATPIEANKELAREILSEGTVLLKNENNALPLKPTDKVAIFGQGQIYTGSSSNGYQIGGGGSGALTPAYTPPSPATALAEAGVDIYQPLTQAYQDSITYVPTAEMYANAAEYANKAIMFISRFSSEGSDRSVGKGDWLLSDAETAMMQELTARFDQVIVLANVVGVIDTSWAVGEVEGIDVDALVMVWTGGAEGANGIADVVTGRTNPSGKLVDTFAKSIDDYPSTDGFFNSAYVNYTEDIFVGYRYFETFNVPVNYEFGFGLSYTTFSTQITGYSSDAENIYVTVTVTNTGAVAGKEVVQLYFEAPQMGTGTAVLGKPAKELAAFAKTNNLAPDESQTITLSFPIRDMSSYDDTGVTGHKSAYVLEAGDYKIYAGNSVKKIAYAGTYTVGELTVVEQLTECAPPSRLPSRLLADGTYEDLMYSGAIISKISGTEPTTVEGEIFYDQGPNVRIENIPGGGQCVAYMNYADEFVTYVIDVEREGLYDFTMRYANGNALVSDAANIFIDNVKQPNITINFPRTGDGTGAGEWYNFDVTAPVVLYLEAGVHDLKIATKRTAFANFDSFTFTPHTATKIFANVPTYFEAEYFDNSGTAGGDLPRREWFPSGSYPANLLVGGEWQPYEGGCLAYMHNAGNWVSYEIDVEQEGDFMVQLRMSNGRAAVTNVGTISINGTDTGISLDCPQTGNGNNGEWYNFMDIEMLQRVHLPAGRSTLTIRSNVTNFPNIDRIILTPIASIGASPVTKVEGESYTSYTGETKVEEFIVDGVPGACVAFLDRIGASATYSLSCTQAGQYDLVFSMANGYDAKDLTAELVINGDEDNVQRLTFNCPRTGEVGAVNRWYNFVELDAGKITLPQGEFTLTLRADHTNFMSPGQTSGSTGGFANVDYMLFKAPEETPEPPRAMMLAAAPARADGEPKEFPDDYVIQLQDVVDGYFTYNELVAQMTIEELASFATGYGAGIGSGTGQIGGSNDVNRKYGIPRADTADGPGGLRLASRSTGWGCEMLMGCTFNVELAEAWGNGVGLEALASGVDIWLAPGMNIHRNPMCGRNFEYYSEDPLLCGKMAAAETAGVQKNGIAVTLKHFACNNKEGNRNNSDSRISERALREIYLEGFRIAVQEGGAWCIMSSYNYINGVETSERYDLLTTILRDEWGFEGFVMTDWGNNSGIVSEVAAGNNVKMSSGNTSQLVTAYNEGEITREVLENNAIDVIRVLAKLPDFTGASLPPTVSRISSTEPTKVEAEVYYDAHPGVQVESGEVINIGYMDIQEDGEYVSYVSYMLDVERGGTYDLMFRAANSRSGTDILELSLDDVIYEDIHWDNPSTGGWQIYVDREVGTIYLPAGEHSLKIKSKGSFGNLDYMIFTPNTLDEGAAITAPESAIKNEKFDVVVKTETAPEKLIFRNENGRRVTATVTSVVEGEGVVTTTASLALGTVGESRVISVYDNDVLLGTFTIRIEEIPDGIISVDAPESVVANETFEFTAVTTKALYKAKLYNEDGNVVKITRVSRVVEGDYATSVYSTSIGTAREEPRTFTFKADYDKRSDWPFAMDVRILVTK